MGAVSRLENGWAFAGLGGSTPSPSACSLSWLAGRSRPAEPASASGLSPLAARCSPGPCSRTVPSGIEQPATSQKTEHGGMAERLRQRAAIA